MSCVCPVYVPCRAERAGGNGTLVINHVDVWPYTMKDSKKEVEAGGGLKHLVAMIPKASGEVCCRCRFCISDRKPHLSCMACNRRLCWSCTGMVPAAAKTCNFPSQSRSSRMSVSSVR